MKKVKIYGITGVKPVYILLRQSGYTVFYIENRISGYVNRFKRD